MFKTLQKSLIQEISTYKTMVENEFIFILIFFFSSEVFAEDRSLTGNTNKPFVMIISDQLFNDSRMGFANNLSLFARRSIC